MKYWGGEKVLDKALDGNHLVLNFVASFVLSFVDNARDKAPDKEEYT